MKRIYYFTAVLLTLLLSGCASTTKLESTPITNTEFSAPLASLKTTYADIPRYEPIWMNWGKFWSSERFTPHPSLIELNSKWGPAKTEKKDWLPWIASQTMYLGYGVFSGSWPLIAVMQLMFIKPTETHTWEKGNNQITARIYTNGMIGYEKRLGYWEWEQNDNQVVSMDSGK